VFLMSNMLEATFERYHKGQNVPKDTTKTPSSENPQQIADSAKQWVASPEGQRAVKKGLEQAQSLAAKFQEAQVVDPETLRKPVTL
jgi:hypothetical protein